MLEELFQTTNSSPKLKKNNVKNAVKMETCNKISKIGLSSSFALKTLSILSPSRSLTKHGFQQRSDIKVFFLIGCLIINSQPSPANLGANSSKGCVSSSSYKGVGVWE